VLFERRPLAEVVVERDARVVDEDVERLDALGRGPDLRRVSDIQVQGRDARVRVYAGTRLA